MTARRTLLAAAIAGAVVVSACGGASEDSIAPAPATEPPADTTIDAPLSPTPSTIEVPNTEPAADPEPTQEGDPTVQTAPDSELTSETISESEPTPGTDTPVTEPTTTAPTTSPPTTTPPPVVGGRTFAEVLSAESDIPTNALPDLVVDDIRRGVKVNVRNVFPADRPVLIWMWAPHWPTCRREAPGVEQFARAHLDEVEVIGLGTQDSLGQAEDFVADYGTESFTMLWDESFQSWQALNVASQPTAILFAADGTPITGWLGGFPEDEALQLARESAAA